VGNGQEGDAELRSQSGACSYLESFISCHFSSCLLSVYSRSNPVEIFMTVHRIIGQLVSVCQHLAQSKGKNVNETFFTPVTSKKKGGSCS